MKILLAIIGILYFITPFDAISDFVIGLGWVDDIVVICILIWIYNDYKKKQHEKINSNNNFEKENQNSDKANEKPNYNKRENYKKEDNKKENNDPYLILGVSKNSNFEEIVKAYKAKALKYHPDKVQHLGKEFTKLAEKKFKEIFNAYQELKKKYEPNK